MKLLTIVSGKFAYSGRRLVHLVKDGEKESLCGKIWESSTWTLVEDTPQNRKKYLARKDICWICIQRQNQPAPKTPSRRKSKPDQDQEKLAKWIASTQK